MMPEILTESFCERCGTRYTFESAAPRKTRRLGQFKTLSKGMKNWVMSDDTSLDEAMAAARNDDERELTSQQLDAFHSTFNFCMNCRQYTCANCWNPAEGRCLTCAPHLGHEVLPAPFPEPAGFEAARIEAEAWPEVDLDAILAAGNGNGGHAEPDPWGAPADTVGIEEIDPAARLAFLSGDAPAPALPADEPVPDWASRGSAETPFEAVAETPIEAVAEAPGETLPTEAPGETFATEAPPQLVGDETVLSPEPVAGWSPSFLRDRAADIEPVAADSGEAALEPEPVVASEAFEADTAAPSAEPLPPTIEGRAAAGATRTTDLLRRFRPGQSLDAELAAFEAELERQEAEATAIDTVAADQPPAEEPAFAEAAWPVAEPEAVAAEPEPEPELVAAIDAAPEPEWIAEPEPIAAQPEAQPEPEPVETAPAPAEPVRDDRIEQPTWQIFAPDAAQPGPAQPADPPAPVLPPGPNGAPQWPVRPDQVESPAMALLANRGNGSANAGLWAASSQEVLAQPARPGVQVTGIQPCSNCGLSLSATARFCRRCGTRQG